MIYHYITGGRRNSYLMKYSDNIMISLCLYDKNLMRNIKKFSSLQNPVIDHDIYKHCLQENI